MGIIDNIKSMFGIKQKKYNLPYLIKTKVHPLRLKAKQNDTVTLEVVVKNVSDEKKLTSVTLKTSRWIGTDLTGLKKIEKIKLGYMEPGDTKTVNFNVHSNSSTPAGNHKAAVIVQSHFKDYNQVMNAVKKIIDIRAA